jgi:hypothetical protein
LLQDWLQEFLQAFLKTNGYKKNSLTNSLRVGQDSNAAGYELNDTGYL